MIETPHGFGTKLAGDGRDPKTIQQILKSADIYYCSIAVPGQVHSSTVAVIDDRNDSKQIMKIPQTDALISREKGIVLSVVTADCVPILYYDPKEEMIGISHGGWKGTLDRISEKVVERMVSMGSKRENILAAIGPSIGSCCYQVYGERLNLFRYAFGESVIKTRLGTEYLDLKQANVLPLLESGVAADHIDVATSCNSCNESEYFSYHRDKGIQGEMLSYINL